MRNVTQGSAARIRATFHDFDGGLADPTTITFYIKREADGVADTLSFGSSAIVREAEGIYYYDWATGAQSGVYTWRVVGTGTVPGAVQGQFYVKPTANTTDTSDIPEPEFEFRNVLYPITAYGADIEATPAANTAAIEAIADLGVPGYVPPGDFVTDVANSANIEGRFWGQGQIVDDDGKRGRYCSHVNARPSDLGDYDSGVLNAFSGDLSKTQFVIEHRITGAGTLGVPSGDYLYTPETAAFFEEFYIGPGAGHNGSHTTAANRTGGVYRYRGIGNSSVGDGIGDVTIGFCDGVDGSASGMLGYLANGAIAHRGGTNTAGADGVYLQVEEVNNNDGGFDVSSLHFNARSNRTNETGALGTNWVGFLSESEGTKRINAGFEISGPHNIGYDAARGDVLAAFTMATTQKFYMNAAQTGGRLYTNDLGNSYFMHNSNTIVTVVNGGTASVLAPTYFATAGGIAPGTPAGATQTGRMFMSSGAPSDSDGSDGDFCLRTGGTVAAKTCLYHKESGVWTAVVP